MTVHWKCVSNAGKWRFRPGCWLVVGVVRCRVVWQADQTTLEPAYSTILVCLVWGDDVLFASCDLVKGSLWWVPLLYIHMRDLLYIFLYSIVLLCVFLWSWCWLINDNSNQCLIFNPFLLQSSCMLHRCCSPSSVLNTRLSNAQLSSLSLLNLTYSQEPDAIYISVSHLFLGR